MFLPGDPVVVRFAHPPDNRYASLNQIVLGQVRYTLLGDDEVRLEGDHISADRLDVLLLQLENASGEEKNSLVKYCSIFIPMTNLILLSMFNTVPHLTVLLLNIITHHYNAENGQTKKLLMNVI